MPVDRPGVESYPSTDRSNRRRLACAIAAHQCQAFCFTQFEAEIVQCNYLAVTLKSALNFDDITHCDSNIVQLGIGRVFCCSHVIDVNDCQGRQEAFGLWLFCRMSVSN